VLKTSQVGGFVANPNWYKGMPDPNYNRKTANFKNDPVKRTAKKLLSQAYAEALSKPVSEDLRQKFGLDEGTHLMADVIARQVVLHSIGEVKDDAISHRSITELRETTEGKTAEKIIAAGTNSELAALAQIMNGNPAPPDGQEADPEDAQTEDAENDFHEDHSHEEE